MNSICFLVPERADTRPPDDIEKLQCPSSPRLIVTGSLFETTIRRWPESEDELDEVEAVIPDEDAMVCILIVCILWSKSKQEKEEEEKERNNVEMQCYVIVSLLPIISAVLPL